MDVHAYYEGEMKKLTDMKAELATLINQSLAVISLLGVNYTAIITTVQN